MNSNWSYSPETVKLGVDLCDLDLWPLTLTFCMDVTFVIGNKSWKFQDDTMMGTWWKRCDGRTDGQTEGRTDWTTHIAAWSQLKIQVTYMYDLWKSLWCFIIYKLFVIWNEIKIFNWSEKWDWKSYNRIFSTTFPSWLWTRQIWGIW